MCEANSHARTRTQTQKVGKLCGWAWSTFAEESYHQLLLLFIDNLTET